MSAATALVWAVGGSVALAVAVNVAYAIYGWFRRLFARGGEPVAAPALGTDRSVVWTGDNEAEVEAFARTARFCFLVGTPLDDFGDHPHHVDTTVLEVYPDHDGPDGKWHWTTAKPGDRIHEDGTVTRGGAS